MNYDTWKATNPEDEFMGSPSVPDRQVFKSCSCGCEYTQENFAKLEYVGRMQDLEVDVDITMRNCSNCNSTIAVDSCEDFTSDNFLPVLKSE